MKKTMMLTILSVIGGFLFADLALAGLIEDRSSYQRLRIRQGIISGQLTPYEARILKHVYTLSDLPS
jgi:hypothetical protein